MDTGTHLVMGLGLAGLATIDPVVAAHTSTAAAVLAGTVIGSQAPDCDGVLRLKGNASYIRNHRGLSHSIPAVIIWIFSITFLLSLIFPHSSAFHLGLWVGIAVCVHVFTDLFNTYGTQAGRPFNEKWIGWNIIHIFDPVIFILHLIAILLWSVHAVKPQIVFPILYGILVVYYVWRTLLHSSLEKKLPRYDLTYEPGHQYVLIPTVRFNVWNIIKKMPHDAYVMGEWRKGRIEWIDRTQCSRHPAAEASKSHSDIASFLYYSSFACAEVHQHKWGYEVCWMDVRYRHRKHYPFVAVLLLDYQFQPLDSYVGWLSDQRVRKKLRVNLNS